MSARAGGSDVSAGTCHAPHTTAMRWCPARTAARMPCRIVASLRRSRRVGVQPSPSAAARSAAIASATAANSSSASPPSRCSTTSSHQRSGSLCPAALASQPSGSSLIRPGRPLRGPVFRHPRHRRRPGRWPLAGRRTGQATRRPSRIASPATRARSRRTARRRSGPVVGRVREYRDRRNQRRVVRKQRVRLGRAFDQDRVGSKGAECRPDGTGRAWTVMPDAQDCDQSRRSSRSGRGRPGRGRASPCAPLPPPRGTIHATPSWTGLLPPLRPGRPRRPTRAPAVAEMSRQRHAVGQHADRLGGGQRASGRFSFVRPSSVTRIAVP